MFEIKPLTWYEDGDGWTTATPFGRLYVTRATPDSYEWWLANRTPRASCASADAAKAAAEAHYRTRVETLLVPVARGGPAESSSWDRLAALAAEAMREARRLSAWWGAGASPAATDHDKARRFDMLTQVLAAWEHPAAVSEISRVPSADGGDTVLTLQVYSPAQPLSPVTADLVT